MTDNPYPPEWDDTPPPDPMDPRLGGVLRSIQPTSAERASVAELVHQYVSRDRSFGNTFGLFWTDRHADHRWPNVFLALLEQFTVTAVGTQGEQLAVERLAEELKEYRKSVAEFGGYR